MDPKDRLSPRNRLSNLNVIHRTPHGAIGEFTWDGETNVLGLCWNGDINDPNDKGNPLSRGEGTWTVLPTPIAKLIKSELARVEPWNAS